MADEQTSVGAKTAPNGLPPAEWTRRWTVVKWSLLFTAAINVAGLVWSMLYGKDNTLVTNIVMGLDVYCGGLVAAYCGFATWDDKNYRDSIVNLRKGAK